MYSPPDGRFCVSAPSILKTRIRYLRRENANHKPKGETTVNTNQTTDRKSRIRPLMIELPADLFAEMEQHRVRLGAEENRFVSKVEIVADALRAYLAAAGANAPEAK